MVNIHTNLWSPDTCGCQFEYSFDLDEPETTRTHNFVRVTKECVSHAHLQGNNKKDMYDSSLEENRRKNGTLKELMDRAGVELTDLQSDGAVTFKSNILINWTWSGESPNRVMTLTVSGITLTAQRKTQIQNFLNNRFGVGKVIFVNA